MGRVKDLAIQQREYDLNHPDEVEDRPQEGPTRVRVVPVQEHKRYAEQTYRNYSQSKKIKQ